MKSFLFKQKNKNKKQTTSKQAAEPKAPEPEKTKMEVEPPAPAPPPPPPPSEPEKPNDGAAVKREENIQLHNRVRKKRAQNIFANPIDMNEKFEAPRYPKSDAAVQFLRSSLEDNFVFTSLSDRERRLLIDAMMLESVPPGTYIITQDDIGDFFYVVEEGQVSFVVDGNKVGSTGTGGSFGELALLYNSPRAASCIAETPCRLWKVDQKTFRFILAKTTNAQQKDLNDVLRKVPFLKDLDDNAMVKITDALTSVAFHEGERIINKGDIGEVFYIVREGNVKVHDIGFGDSTYDDLPLGPGDFFGERALMTGDKRAANVTATSACTCLCLSRDTFESVLGPLQNLIDLAMRKRALLSVPLFSNSQFEQHELALLTDKIVEVTFQAGSVLAEEGKPFAHNLYIIRRGDVAVANDDGKINSLKDADYFGDKYLKEPDDFLSKQTIKVQAETTCGVLSKKDIESVIGDIRRLGKPLVPTGPPKSDIRFKDLQKVKILGVGTFGKVWLVSHKRTNTPYALKQLSKREIIGHHQVEGVLREKNLMASMKHPFVVELVATFQDDKHLYMLIGLVQGGELFSVIHSETRDGIPNGSARFYSACILESLSHLHQRSICYRDLKPENVLIDDKGYSVLVDLGFAKIVTDKTYTLCGTPEYLAPEIILSKGHDKGVDYWAYGVLVYEMLVGRSPFYSYGTDQVSLFKRIVQVRYTFPHGVVHDLAQDLIQRLIVRRQTNRLGCLSRGDEDVREHKWFSVVDVDKLLKKQLPPPWKPSIKDALDASHFETYKYQDKDKETKGGLSSAQQALFKDF